MAFSTLALRAFYFLIFSNDDVDQLVVACIVPVLQPLIRLPLCFKCSPPFVQAFYHSIVVPSTRVSRSLGIAGHFRHSSGFPHAHLAGKAHSFHTTNL
jgi:hypothetical protein